MKSWAAGLGLAWLIASSGAQAAVYRCEAQGRVLFTDRPCHAGAAPQTIRTPNTMDGRAGLALAREYDRRIRREQRARDRADAGWLEQHEQRKAKAARLREGRVLRKPVAGMSPADVRQVLGEPDRTARVDGEDDTHERWTYERGDGSRATVSFSGGEVVKVRTGKAKKKAKR